MQRRSLADPFLIAAQQKRALVLAKIRQFFAERDVLEVDTPVMAHAPVTDPYLTAIQAVCLGKTYYLQTSPEYAMKRLLCLGSGSIYQICKAFRDEGSGRIHRPEFTMLEWYRLGFSDGDLMDEIEELVIRVSSVSVFIRLSYREVFERYLNFNPHQISLPVIAELAKTKIPDIQGLDNLDVNDYLNLLFQACIEPNLPVGSGVFIYDYPASMAALAQKVQVDGVSVAKRFELYLDGVELANGYLELLDPAEQALRFDEDLQKRRELGLPEVPVDQCLLEAMHSGLPACAGVALGLDRLLMF